MSAKWFVWKALLLAGLCAVYSYAQQAPGLPAFREGIKYYRAKDYASAIRKFNEAISLEPTNYRYYVAKGRALLQLKRYDEAIQAFEEAVKYNKNYSAAYLMIARIAIKQKDWAKAVQYLEKAYQIEGDATKRIKYKIFIVKLLLRDNRASEALTSLQQLKNDIPEAANDPRILYAEGDIYLKMERYDEAINAFQAAVNKVAGLPKPQAAKYYFGLGMAYFKKGDVEQAKRVWANVKGTRYERLAYQLQQRSGAKFYLAIANGYAKANAYDEAIEQAQKAVEKSSDAEKSLSYKFLGILYYKKGQVQQAITNLAQAAQYEKDPAKRTKLYNIMIKLQMNNGDYSGALKTADQILSGNPNNHSVLFLKGQAEYQLGNYSAAIVSLERAIASAPQNKIIQAKYNFLLGMSAKKAGDLNKALKAFKNAMFGPFRLAAREEIGKLRKGAGQ